MNVRKFKILCDGQFNGFIFISDNHPKFPKCKVATIWPFERRGNWTTGDLELVGQQQITDLYDISTTDNQIKTDLVERSSINPNDCVNFNIEEY